MVIDTADRDRTRGRPLTDRSGGSPFDGRVALVTGAASGIGLATTLALQEGGASVSALDVKRCREGSGQLRLQADVTDQAAVDAAVTATMKEFGQLDILVNNAGIGAVGTVADNPDEEWHRLFDTNVMGMVRTTRTALPHLRRSDAGAIINVSSVAATVGLPERVCYSVTKGGVLALTLALAADLLQDGIRVNCVCPGTVDTPWVTGLLDATPAPTEYRAALEERQPMGRLGTAQEIASAIVFLAAPTSSFITGTALRVDGGLIGVRGRARPRT